ncbi:hypothetical protein RUM43_007530 [Polyplax serrata]|uniref:SHSP domain-containing protein n=1 Tax=Polyplax serrata TaxID=468196 RepID=A0AAN8S8Q4_POLSC
MGSHADCGKHTRNTYYRITFMVRELAIWCDLRLAIAFISVIDVKVAVDMNYFHPSEMSVKVIDNTVVVVEAKHKERPDEQFGSISRHFLHRYRLPNNVDPTSITSDLSDKGILTVTATKK